MIIIGTTTTLEIGQIVRRGTFRDGRDIRHRNPVFRVMRPFYSSQKIYLAHEIGYWRAKLDTLIEDTNYSNAVKFAAQSLFHYAGLWLQLVEKGSDE